MSSENAAINYPLENSDDILPQEIMGFQKRVLCIPGLAIIEYSKLQCFGRYLEDMEIEPSNLLYEAVAPTLEEAVKIMANKLLLYDEMTNEPDFEKMGWVGVPLYFNRQLRPDKAIVIPGSEMRLFYDIVDSNILTVAIASQNVELEFSFYPAVIKSHIDGFNGPNGIFMRGETAEGAVHSTKDLVFNNVVYLYCENINIELKKRLYKYFREHSYKLVIRDPEERENRRKTKDQITIERLIDTGENNSIEFKVALKYNIFESRCDTSKKNKIAGKALRAICSFLNTHGGTLLIGINDKDKSVAGIENDFGCIERGSKDTWMLYLDDLISHHIGDAVTRFVRKNIFTYNGKLVALIEVKQCWFPVYLKLGGEKAFYIRRDGSSKELSGEAIDDYINTVELWTRRSTYV